MYLIILIFLSLVSAPAFSQKKDDGANSSGGGNLFDIFAEGENKGNRLPSEKEVLDRFKDAGNTIVQILEDMETSQSNELKKILTIAQSTQSNKSFVDSFRTNIAQLNKVQFASLSDKDRHAEYHKNEHLILLDPKHVVWYLGQDVRLMILFFHESLGLMGYGQYDLRDNDYPMTRVFIDYILKEKYRGRFPVKDLFLERYSCPAANNKQMGIAAYTQGGCRQTDYYPSARGSPVDLEVKYLTFNKLGAKELISKYCLKGNHPALRTVKQFVESKPSSSDWSENLAQCLSALSITASIDHYYRIYYRLFDQSLAPEFIGSLIDQVELKKFKSAIVSLAKTYGVNAGFDVQFYAPTGNLKIFSADEIRRKNSRGEFYLAKDRAGLGDRLYFAWRELALKMRDKSTAPWLTAQISFDSTPSPNARISALSVKDESGAEVYRGFSQTGGDKKTFVRGKIFSNVMSGGLRVMGDFYFRMENAQFIIDIDGQPCIVTNRASNSLQLKCREARPIQ